MTKSMRGFAGMKARDPKRQLEEARKGGAAVPNDKRTFSKDRDLASRAGALGGKVSRGGGRKKKAPGLPVGDPRRDFGGAA